MTTAFLPLLQKSTEMQHGYSGCVINITSISGLVRISQGTLPFPQTLLEPLTNHVIRSLLLQRLQGRAGPP